MLFLNSSLNVASKQNVYFKSSPQKRLEVVEQVAASAVGNAYRNSTGLGCLDDLFRTKMGEVQELKGVVTGLAKDIWKKSGGGAKSHAESTHIWNIAEQNVRNAFGLITKAKTGEPVYRFVTKEHPAQAVNKSNFTNPIQSSLCEIKNQARRLLGDNTIPSIPISINPQFL